MGTLHTLQDNLRSNCNCKNKCGGNCRCGHRKKDAENVNIINIGNSPYRQNNETSIIPPVVIPSANNYSSIENNTDYHDTITNEKQSVFPESRIVEKAENLRNEDTSRKPQLIRSAPFVPLPNKPEEKIELPEYLLIFEDSRIYPEFY